MRSSRRLQNKRPKTSINDDDGSEPIPMDLLIEIFLKLPVKSITTCRHILLACRGKNDKDGFVFFFPNQPQNPDRNSSPIKAYPLTHVPGACDVSRPVHGMVLLRGKGVLKGSKTRVDVSVIYNPSTGDFLTLPKTKTTKKTRNMSFMWQSYLGYDPITKQYKVLSMAYKKRVYTYEQKLEECVESQVLTLGTGKLSWHVVECCITQFPPKAHSEICINGVLFYRAEVKDSSGVTMRVVSFDFRSEEFNVMKFTESFTLADSTALVNYNGKLGVLITDDYGPHGRFFTNRSTNFELWVLKDVVKHEWSKHIYVLPPLWKDAVNGEYLCFAGIIGTDEIVLLSPSMPYVVYYNIKRKTIIKVKIQGIVTEFHIFLNHIENVKLIRA
ncbi:putative F-box protein At3g23960 isoform X2 [Capsella rubella]|uniref:putative F-box protein At3g23960 isoform X2 n=1 Tax=Capsella rubella TaxID=81985 RepID=UPI000CD537F9|nr:putative F-box protein At3g23960 isoform X2 [Capsella rubella]